MDNPSSTTNASLDSRPQFLVQDLPRSVLPSKDNKNNEQKEKKPDNNNNNNNNNQTKN
jgi:hypothetical protein